MGGLAGDPYESQQDVGELNLMTLIGCVAERGPAWHQRDDLQGAENNHYQGLIPLEDVTRRLMGWHPLRAKVAYLVPSTVEAADVLGDDGKPYRVIPTQQERIGVLRDDTYRDLGVFSSGANHPPYQVTLIEEAERLTGTQLGISSAGVLQEGARAWIEYSMEATLHDDKSGLDYRPNLVKADSMDGSISLTTALTIEATVCMNTLTRNLKEAKGAGTLFRRKHTSGILGDLKTERDALGILEVVDEEFVSELHEMIEQEVTPKQRIELLEILVPIPEDASERSVVLALNKRERLMALSTDPRVEPWLGNAFGEFQRYNTDDHWQAPAKGTGQWERNTWRTLTGKRAEYDRNVASALAKVLA